MEEIVIEIPDAIYKKSVELAEKLNVSFDELCSLGVKILAEEHLREENENF